ncbi:DMT family transporter [Colwellia sp. MSW7]|uniref:DMT family transporter n=1 Tax=Colwellia maritima TaxID=2912588 RepID=A0ABS9X9V1_9GAMM|nr:EamA family transporter [Colwellia maritima]MCI2285827.1 DMT family transporter [Colwellia maritima]
MENINALVPVECCHFNTFIYIGLTSTNASNATILQSVIPIFILILSALWLKERVSAQQWLGVAISLTGVLMLITQGKLDHLLSLVFNIGDIYVLVGVLCWATYSIILRWRPPELDGFTFFGVTVLLGAFILLPFAGVEWYLADDIVWQSKIAYTIVYMAIFPSILAYIFWNKGVADIGAVKTGLFIHFMPLFGVILSSIFLNEPIYQFHIIGIVLILSGVYLVVKAKLA